MNLPKIYLIAILLLAIGIGANGQEPPKAVLVDEFGTLCSDDLRTRLDNFFQTIHQTPESLGYIVGNAEQLMSGRLLKYFRMLQHHVRFRGFYDDRVKYLRGPNSDSMRFQFWLVPNGAQPADVPLSFPKETYETTVMFDASEIGSVKKGVVEFGGVWANEPCDFGLSLNQFAITLGANPTLEGYLVGSSAGRRDATRTKTDLNLTANELVTKHLVPARRIKTIYVGNRGERTMQLWLVPKGGKLPTFREKSVP